MIVLDLETQQLAADVGGWANIEALRVSVAVTWDEESGYRTWWEAQAGDLLQVLERAPLIVGFNVSVFDYRVLNLYGRTEMLFSKTRDLHREVLEQTGRRVGLARLALLNLGESKALESGLDAVELYQAGELETLAAYCQKDVELTKRLYELWRTQGAITSVGAELVFWPREWGR